MLHRLAYLAALLVALPAFAIDPTLCKDDGVTEVPPFAYRDPVTQCLYAKDPGAAPPVPIQYETFHRKGVASCEKSKTSLQIDLKAQKYGGCRTKDAGHYCTQLVWDTTIDNYLDPGCKNEDVVFFGQGPPFQALWFHSVFIGNGWKCGGGVGWNGPNGLSCAKGEDSAAHSDGMQVRGQPVNGGWFVMQDSVFVNGFNLHLLQQTSSQWGPNGSDLFQGVEYGRRQNAGAATTWIDDCQKRRNQSDTNGADICPEGRTLLDTPLKQAWLVDVWGVTRINPKATAKTVIVNTGCGKDGCNGTLGYTNGWPHPYSRSGTGPKTCPNGMLASGPDVYCYTSIERALRDHARPPYLCASTAGWENYAESCGEVPTEPLLPPSAPRFSVD